MKNILLSLVLLNFSFIGFGSEKSKSDEFQSNECLASENLQTNKEDLALTVESDSPSPSYTYVKEYGSYAVSFLEDSTKHVLAIDLSSCYLLVVRNLEKDKDGNSFISFFSLSHLPSSLLSNSLVNGHSSLERSLQNILNEFKRVGGKIESAEYIIYGGVFNQIERQTFRQELRDKINQVVLTLHETDITKDSTEDSSANYTIQEPEKHWQNRVKGSRKYLFTKTLLEPYWVEEDMSQDTDIKIKDISLSSNDIFCENIGSTLEEKYTFLKMINSSYFSISNVLDEQTEILQRAIRHSADSEAQTLRVVRIVDEKGIFKPNFCAICHTTCQMQCPCHSVYYCSKEHQRKHWKVHKRNCPHAKK